MKLSAFLATVGAFSDEFWARYPHPLLLQEGADPEREVFSLRAPAGALVIGRAPPADLVIAHATVSVRHARLHAPGSGPHWGIEDQGSTNGTKLDGKLLALGVRADLVEGALLQLGSVAFHFLAPASFRARVERRPQAVDEPTQEVRVPARVTSAPDADAVGEILLRCDPLEPLPLRDGVTVVIGREQGSCDLVLADSKLSRRHTELRREGGRILVRDLGSTNGTFLDGRRLTHEAVELFPRRHVTLGPFTVWIDVPEEPTQLTNLERAKGTSRIAKRPSDPTGDAAAADGGLTRDFGGLVVILMRLHDVLVGDRAVDSAEIRAAREQVTALTRQLLGLCDRLQGPPLIVDVNAVVAETAERMKLTIGERIDVQVRLASAALWVRIDPQQLEQAIVNLAANARDAMPRGGGLGLETCALAPDEVAGEWPSGTPPRIVSIAVSDTGCGIPPELKERLFEPFFTSKGGAGTGFGLPKVRDIATRNAGRVEFESLVGAGSTFRLLFPASEIGDAPER